MSLIVLPELIVLRDTVEVVRDQIAFIIAEDQAAQLALAQASTDPNVIPDEYVWQTWVDRSNPLEGLLNAPTGGSSANPITPPAIVNVWFDTDQFAGGQGNAIERSKYNGRFNVDCYGFGVAQVNQDQAGQHLPGDFLAAQAAMRIARFVRGILMAAHNTYLQFPRNTLVWGRRVMERQSFQPLNEGDTPATRVRGVRLIVEVGYNEFSQQVPATILEILHVDVHRAIDGKIVAQAEYDYT